MNIITYSSDSQHYATPGQIILDGDTYGIVTDPDNVSGNNDNNKGKASTAFLHVCRIDTGLPMFMVLLGAKFRPSIRVIGKGEVITIIID